MKILQLKNDEVLASRAADLIGAQILLKPNCVLGLATGSTPVGTYRELVARFQAGALDFSQVTTVNLDEYGGLAGDHPQSYRYFMEQHLFSKVNLPHRNTHLPDATAPDPQAECARYDQLIQSLGGIDLQLLGIGHNGHIGFNEPDASFIVPTHPVDLKAETIRANARFFERIEQVPKTALTMGIGAIMRARRVLLLAGEGKAEILRAALYGPVTPQVPASILQLHPNLTVMTTCSI